MAAIDFPPSPTDGQLFSAPNGVIYQWSAPFTAWLSLGGANSGAYVGSTPPTNPYVGQFWWSNETGALFIYYFDGSSSQWVPANPSPQNILQQTWRQLQRTVVAVAQPNVEITVIPSDINSLWVNFHLVPVNNAVNCQVRTYESGILQTTNYAFGVYVAGMTTPADGNVITMTSTGAVYSGGWVLSYAKSGGQVSNSAATGIKGDFKLPQFKSGRATLVGQATYLLETGTSDMCCTCHGARQPVNPITGLQMFPSSGNWQVGSIFEVWGSP